MKELTEEAKKFWSQKEKEKGGKVDFFTFATYIGRSNDKNVNLGGLLYTIKSGLYFEDFEKENWLYKIMGRSQKYEKTEFGIDINEIEEIKTVSKGSALNCIAGSINDGETKEISRIGAFFFQPVTQIKMKTGYSLFFEIMRYREFFKAMREKL
ncbi:MAG: hypothetical protein DRP54_07295 [Spirochaetes bacterium]|nr:MAG: hypothetical protein DRP54_07295 [Spirochaetota bacterium]